MGASPSGWASAPGASGTPASVHPPARTALKAELQAPVAEWMVSPVFALREGTALTAAARQLETLNVSALPVLDVSSRLIGVFSSVDLLRAGRFVSEDVDRARHLRLPDAGVEDFMKTCVPVIRPHLTLAGCARRMSKQGLHRLYVAEDGPLEGVVSTREMLGAVAQLGIETPLAQLAQRTIATISVRDSLASALARLRQNPTLTLVVTSDEVAVGVFTRADASVAREADPTERVSLWMDASVISLPAELPAQQAAQRLRDAQRRYIAVCEGRAIIGLISGLGFTELIAADAGAQ